MDQNTRRPAVSPCGARTSDRSVGDSEHHRHGGGQLDIRENAEQAQPLPDPGPWKELPWTNGLHRVAGLGAWRWELKQRLFHYCDIAGGHLSLPDGPNAVNYSALTARIDPANQDDLAAFLSGPETTSTVKSLEIRITGEDGGVVRCLHLSGQWYEIPGEAPMMRGVIHDTTTRKNAESALRKSESRLAEAQDIASLGHWEWEIESNTLYWSHGIYKMFGRAAKQFEATYPNFLKTIHPEDRDLVSRSVNDALEDRAAYAVEHRLVKPNGEIRWVFERGRVFRNYDGEPIRMLGTVLDISERVQTESLLRENERLLAEAQKIAQTGSWQYDNTTGALEYSEQCYEVLGVSRDEFEPSVENWLALVHPDDREIAERNVHDILNEAVELNYELRIVRPDGAMRYVHQINLPIVDGKGTVIGRRGTIQDVTDRRLAENEIRELNEGLEQRVLERTQELRDEVNEREQAQAALEESEMRFRAVLDTAADAIISINSNGTILSYNEAAHRVFGHAADSVLGANVSLLMPGDISAKHDGYLANYLKTGDATIIGSTREVNGMRSDGALFPMELSVSETRTRMGRSYTGIMRDISERKADEETLRQTIDDLRRTQSQLVEAEKMASLGGLVAGVAHEINTPVGIGVTAASHLEETVQALKADFSGGTLKRSDLEKFVATAGESIDIVTTNLRHAATLIGSFKKIAVDQSSEDHRRFDLGEYISEVITSLGPRLKRSSHNFIMRCEDEIVIDGDPGAISQIITNLVLNSIEHAYPENQSGALSLDIKRVDDKIHILFEDDGKGIDDATLPHIFEPFFTTRRGSGGSGLGLNIVYNLVRQRLGGTIRCVSEAGNGAQFIIEFTAHAGEDNP